MRKILTLGKILMGSGLKGMKESKIGGILSKFLDDLCQKGEPCENGTSNPLHERVRGTHGLKGGPD